MSEADTAFDALAEEFFSVWFRYHPDIAAEAGIAGFERLLPAQNDDELSALGGWLESLVVAVEELDYDALDATRRVDLRLMFSTARVEHQELLERDWRHRDPLRYLPVGEIFQLTLRQPEDVRDALVSLLGTVPEYLRRALSQLRSMAELIAPDSVAVAVDEAERGRCYLRELANSTWLRRRCYSWSEVEGLIDGACSALAAFGASLSREIASRAVGRLGCGEAHLRFLLRHRHFVALEPARVRSVLSSALGRAEQELVAACEEVGVEPGKAWECLESDWLTGADRMVACRSESARLEAFLRVAGIVSLPDAVLRVSQRPPCPRPLRFGADYVPDRGERAGTFFLGVAPGTDGGEPRAVLQARCLDKTWGGAHLLAFAAGDDGWRLPRRLSDGASLIGAWRLYLRERLVALGYLESESRLFAALQRQWFVRRALLDLDLHLGVVDGVAALDRLEGIPGANRADLVRIAHRPGDALTAVLGWQALERSRDLIQGQEGGAFEESRFHDRLLRRGPIPLALILSEELGERAWRQIANGLGI